MTQFATQINFGENGGFGILRYLMELLKPLEDGKYVIVKDPTKSLMRIYAVPFDSFEMDEEEEEEDEEEGDMIEEEDRGKGDL